MSSNAPARPGARHQHPTQPPGPGDHRLVPRDDRDDATRDCTVVDDADLAAIRLPLLDEPEEPSSGVYHHQHTRAWSRRVAAADAVVVVTARVQPRHAGAVQERRRLPLPRVGLQAGRVHQLRQHLGRHPLAPDGEAGHQRAQDGPRGSGPVDADRGRPPRRHGGGLTGPRRRGRVRPRRPGAGGQHGAPALRPPCLRRRRRADPRPRAPAAYPCPTRRSAAPRWPTPRSCWCSSAPAGCRRPSTTTRSRSPPSPRRSTTSARGSPLAGLGGAPPRSPRGSGPRAARRCVVGDRAADGRAGPRRTGLGRWLLRYAECAAPDDVTSVGLFTGARSLRNLALYQRAGYHRGEVAGARSGW